MIASFWVSFVVTLALLGAAVVTGVRGRRRAHFVLAPSAIAMLVVTIVLTEMLVRAAVFPEREMAIHLVIAQTASGLVVAAAATGLMTVRRPRFRVLHRVFVVLFLVAALAAVGTGIWVFTLSTPR